MTTIVRMTYKLITNTAIGKRKRREKKCQNVLFILSIEYSIILCSSSTERISYKRRLNNTALFSISILIFLLFAPPVSPAPPFLSHERLLFIFCTKNAVRFSNFRLCIAKQKKNSAQNPTNFYQEFFLISSYIVQEKKSILHPFDI